MHTKASLRAWLELSDETIEQFLERLPTICALVPGSLTVPGVVTPDPKDDMVIAVAIEGGASHIVSEDRHLLGLGEWQGILIVDRNQMMAELDLLANK